MASTNHRGKKKDDFSLDIDDKFINGNQENVGVIELDFDNQILMSDLTPIIKPSIEQSASSSSENNEESLSTFGDGENMDVCQQTNKTNVPQEDQKSKTHWISSFLIIVSKFLSLFLFTPIPFLIRLTPFTATNEEEQIIKWKGILKSINADMTENALKRKVDAFLCFQNTTRLK